MNPVQSFFRKYGAVPATDRGPQYHLGTPEAVCIHAESVIAAWESDPESRPELLPDAKDLRRDLWRRLKQYPEGAWLDEQYPHYRRQLAAWFRLCERIGFRVDA